MVHLHLNLLTKTFVVSVVIFHPVRQGKFIRMAASVFQVKIFKERFTVHPVKLLFCKFTSRSSQSAKPHVENPRIQKSANREQDSRNPRFQSDDWVNKSLSHRCRYCKESAI